VASLNLHGLDMYDAPCDEDIFDGLNPITFLKCSPSRNALLLLLLLLLLLFFERDVENVRFPSLSFPNIVDNDFIAGAPPASEKEEEEEEVEHEENNEDALLAQRVVFWRNLVMFLKQKIAAREKTEEREREEEEEEGRKSRSKEFNLRAAKKSEKRRKVNSRCR